AVLQGKWSCRVLAVLHVDRLDAVQPQGQLLALGDDLIGVPLAARRVDDRHRNRGDVDDGPGAVLRLGPDVPDVRLVAELGADLLGIGAREVDALVGVGSAVDLGADLEVLVGLLRAQVASLAGVGDDRAAFDAPVGVAHAVPVLDARLAVDEGLPAAAARAARLGACEEGGGQHEHAAHHGPSAVEWDLTSFRTKMKSAHVSAIRVWISLRTRAAGKGAAGSK